MQIGRFIIALTVLASLSACEANTGNGTDNPGETPTDTEATASPTPGSEETVSILRADIEQPEIPTPPLGPLNITIGFPEGGSALDAAGLLELQKIIISEQIEQGSPVVLRGHSDAEGSDEVNLRASRTRAERVQKWLVENGIAKDRIEIIAFGEQNPIAPNALPDGAPNEEGRALNRRVEVEIIPPEEAPESPEAG